MAIIATNKGGSGIDPIEAGTYVARCVQIVHIGVVDDEYKGKKTRPNKVRIAWELPTEMHVFDEAKGEEPRLISKEYTLSLTDKANLRHDLEAWRGQAFTDKELAGFDISKILGQPCMLSIVNGKSVASGNTYAKISSVGKLAKGMTCPDQLLEGVLFMYDEDVATIIDNFGKLPEFVQDKIVTSDEWKALKIERPQSEISGAPSEPNDEVSNAIADAGDDEAYAPAGADAPPF